MSTTCNAIPPSRITLPSPAEFERLTANQFESIRDINADLEEIQTVPLPPTTLAGKIAAHLPEKRGQKLLGCRNKGLTFKYSDGRRAWRPGFPCHMTICCAPCAMDQAADQYSKYAGLTLFIQQRFTRITIPIAVPDTSTVKSCYDSLMKLLRKSIPKIPTLAKIKPSSDTVEILVTATLSESATAKILHAYPDAMIRQHYQSNFSRELHHVVDTDHVLFSNPELAALADRRYQKTCLLRTQGISREDRIKLSRTDPIRDNLSESVPESASDGGFHAPKSTEKLYHRTASGHLMQVPACPCGCGSPPTHFAYAKLQHEAVPDEDWIPIVIVTETQRLIELKQLKT